MMWEILKPYMNECAMTNNILQDVRDFAKVDLFGEPEDNVKKHTPLPRQFWRWVILWSFFLQIDVPHYRLLG